MGQMISSQINEINSHYLRKQQHTVRKSTRPSCQVKVNKNDGSTKLRRQKITQPTSVTNNEAVDYQRLIEEEKTQRLVVRKAKEQLSRKAKERLYIFPN